MFPDTNTCTPPSIAGCVCQGRSYDELVARICVIAKPLASEKLTKKLYKVRILLFGDLRRSAFGAQLGPAWLLLFRFLPP